MSVGDHVAFGEYVRSRSHALLRAAQAMTGNRADAEDLLQATLVKAYQSWDRIDDQAALDTYVRRVMVNTHLTRWRRWGSRVRLGEVPEFAADDAGLVRSEERDALMRALGGLTARQRAVLVLRYLEDLPDPAIAGLLGCRPATVRSQAARGLAALRPLMDLPDAPARGRDAHAG